MPEFSERGRYVTEQVTLWLENDAQALDSARQVAELEGVKGLTAWVRKVLAQAGRRDAAWHVRQELAANDYDRINFGDVYEAITDED